jgi:hypothetical protein
LEINPLEIKLAAALRANATLRVEAEWRPTTGGLCLTELGPPTIVGQLIRLCNRPQRGAEAIGTGAGRGRRPSGGGRLGACARSLPGAIDRLKALRGPGGRKGPLSGHILCHAGLVSIRLPPHWLHSVRNNGALPVFMSISALFSRPPALSALFAPFESPRAGLFSLRS